jgi:hypothetical protein
MLTFSIAKKMTSGFLPAFNAIVVPGPVSLPRKTCNQPWLNCQKRNAVIFLWLSAKKGKARLAKSKF